MAIIIGILVLALGAVMVVETEWFLNNFGRIAWFEEKLGTDGGSRLGYKLIGLLFIFIGIIAMTGSSNEFLAWLTGPLTKYNRPQ